MDRLGLIYVFLRLMQLAWGQAFVKQRFDLQIIVEVTWVVFRGDSCTVDEKKEDILMGVINNEFERVLNGFVHDYE